MRDSRVIIVGEAQRELPACYEWEDFSTQGGVGLQHEVVPEESSGNSLAAVGSTVV